MFIFVLFNNSFTEKIVDFSVIRTRIVRGVSKDIDHLTSNIPYMLWLLCRSGCLSPSAKAHVKVNPPSPRFVWIENGRTFGDFFNKSTSTNFVFLFTFFAANFFSNFFPSNFAGNIKLLPCHGGVFEEWITCLLKKCFRLFCERTYDYLNGVYGKMSYLKTYILVPHRKKIIFYYKTNYL